MSVDVNSSTPRWAVVTGIRRRVVVIVCLVPSFFLGWRFWCSPAMDPLTAPALLLDRGLQLAILGWIPAVIVIGTCRPVPAGYAAGYASIVGVVLALSVDMSALIRPPADRMVVGVATVSLFLSAGVFIWLVWTDEILLPKLTGETAKIGAAVLGSAVALLGWWNQASFLPGRTEAKLTQAITAEVSDVPRGILRYTATNPTDSRVLVVRHELIACWWKSGEKMVWAIPKMRERSNCRQFIPIQRSNWIAGNSTYTWQTTMSIPADAAQIVVLSRISIARGDRLRVSRDVSTGGPKMKGCGPDDQVDIVDESRLKSLAQEDKYVVYDQTVRSSDGFYLASDPVSDCLGDDPYRLAEYYGVSTHQTLYQTWVGVTGAANPPSG